MSMKGHYSSNGFASGITITSEDSDMVALLRNLGAVFYVKTNQPQTIMHLETHSVYGRTLNPYNTDLTPGGSSGGESALIALKGSCLGVGT
jgi:amidase